MSRKNMDGIIIVYDLYTGEFLYGLNPNDKHKLKSSKSGMSYYKVYRFSASNYWDVKMDYEPMEIGWML